MVESCKDRVFRYTEYVEHAIKQLTEVSDPKPREIVDLAERYLKDSVYYLQRGDVCTSLSCVSYAEGLLDALRMLGKLDFSWPPPDVSPRKKVLVGGVFDIIHPGHIYFLRKAAEHGKVYVVVARDSTVVKEKGRKPILDEKSRTEVLNSIKWVYKAFLGEDPPNFRKVLEKVLPDVVFLGPDQRKLIEPTKKAIKELGLNTEIIILDHKFSDFSSSKIKQQIKECR